MAKITYADKTNKTPILDRPKQVCAEDLNEIKQVVNDNYKYASVTPLFMDNTIIPSDINLYWDSVDSNMVFKWTDRLILMCYFEGIYKYVYLISNISGIEKTIKLANTQVAYILKSDIIAASNGAVITPTITVWNNNNLSDNNKIILGLRNVSTSPSYTSGILADFAIKNNTSNKVTRMRIESRLHYAVRGQINYTNGVISATGSIFIFNNTASVYGYLRFNSLNYDISEVTTSGEFFTFYLQSNSIKNFLSLSGGVIEIVNTDIKVKVWTDANVGDLNGDDVLILWTYHQPTDSIISKLPITTDEGGFDSIELFKKQNEIEVWENKYPNVYEKISKFIQTYAFRIGADIEDAINIIMLGDSLFARENHTSVLNVVQDSNPPCLVTKNIGAYLWEHLQGSKPVYSRYDKAGRFTETGVWSEVTVDATWDDSGDRPVHTKVTTSSGASVAFTVGITYDYFNFIDRTDLAGTNAASIAISEGSGKVEARIEGGVWAEANGLSFSQLKATTGGGYGNTRYQRRIEFRKVSTGIGASITVTISKPADSSRLMYWGIEEMKMNKPYVKLINSARGGHTLTILKNYIEDDVFERNPKLVILELPLLNMLASDNTITGNVNNVHDFVWGDRVGFENANSLKNRSNDWTDFSVLLIIPHFSRVMYNADGTFVEYSNGFTPEEIYKAIKGLIYSKGDLPFIDLSSAIRNEAISDPSFANIYDAFSSSGETGNGYFDDSLHQNDKGTLVWAKHLCPIFHLSNY